MTGPTPTLIDGTGTPTTPVTFTISGVGADKNLFAIDSLTGVVSMTAKDFENPVDAGGNNTYEIEITATDNVGVTATEGWIVTVIDVTEVFNIATISDATVNENELYTGPTPTLIDGTGTPTTPVTFTISGVGADKNLFAIDSLTGVVSMTAKDFENPVDAGGNNTYEIEITATDNVGVTATEGWSVTVIDVTEVFNIATIPNDTVNENELYDRTYTYTYRRYRYTYNTSNIYY